MSRRLARFSLALVILLSSEVWALGLGEIRLNSALNQPLRAEIELLSATPDELANLQVAMASADTFDRYGLDRPVYLQRIQFQIIKSGRVDGNYVELRSAVAITEPFLTFLVEASWSRGRLLREYTVLLDPPTFAPPAAAESVPAVTAPTRSTTTDSGRIEAAAPEPQRAEPAPRVTPAGPRPQPAPVVDDSPYDASEGGDLTVQRGDTLWGIAQRIRPDSRLTMNQTMIAIFEANRDAFGGNINLLRAGASLRIPSADAIFRISRGEALSEVQRQYDAWGSGTVADDASTRPSLILVPPDDDIVDDAISTDADAGVEPLTREQEIEQRISDLLAAPVPEQQSLIQIRDNELATLRQELARIRGEVYEPPPIDEPAIEVVEDDPFADDDDIMVDDDADAVGIDDIETVDDVEDVTPEPTPVRPTRSEPSLVDRALDALTSIWAIIIGALVVAGGVLFWFMRRGGDDDDDVEAWRALDADEGLGDDTFAATESLRAPTPQDESIMVVEQERGRAGIDATVDAPAPEFGGIADAEEDEATGEFGSLEDTFSSETALNLDQSDPIAEADFHMAYGLYDQAADLINGALSVEPERQDLLTKLCEIYFVWGNRDAFVDAAGRVKAAVAGSESADWDKIVIMGQQIAGDDQLFAGADVAAATKAVDLSFGAGMDETGALDMELISDAGATDDIVDFGYDDAAGGVDFQTGETEIMPDVDVDSTSEMLAVDGTVEMPATETTVETPTIEEQFEGFDGTAELPSIEDTLGKAIESSGQTADETAEINLDDLGLDLGGLDDVEVASFDDLDATSESETISETGINESLGDVGEVTGKNPQVDPNATGVQTALSPDDTGFSEALDVGEALGVTAEVPGIDAASTDVDIDSSLLDATGMTQVLSDDFTVETTGNVRAALSDDDATMLASGYGDDDATLLAGLDDDDDADYDFAKTEALPADVFTGDASLDSTGEMPAIASTNVDLDLDDLTAALQVSEVGDTIEQLRDDATVEQPRPDVGSRDDYEIETLALGPGEMSDDLTDARTMTEVGTKLDLARAYVDMGDPAGARSILEEVLDEGDEGQRQQAQQLLDSLPS